MLTEQGLRCLNNPAQVMCRVELLKTLNARGFNPFNVTRADEHPTPHDFRSFFVRRTTIKNRCRLFSTTGMSLRLSSPTFAPQAYLYAGSCRRVLFAALQ